MATAAAYAPAVFGLEAAALGTLMPAVLGLSIGYGGFKLITWWKTAAAMAAAAKAAALEAAALAKAAALEAAALAKAAAAAELAAAGEAATAAAVDTAATAASTTAASVSIPVILAGAAVVVVVVGGGYYLVSQLPTNKIRSNIAATDPRSNFKVSSKQGHKTKPPARNHHYASKNSRPDAPGQP